MNLNVLVKTAKMVVMVAMVVTAVMAKMAKMAKIAVMKNMFVLIKPFISIYLVAN